ncbi:hypothetical protein BDZ45DRAFT_719878 [Acephala macrosclerotiorum]|nr:hypothetical protein BDZ45DRAFT_719878 [Acephala macrosclerotiorum]
MASQYPVRDTYQHRRTKSSVLSFMHKRTPSAGAALSSNDSISPTHPPVSFLPNDHPHYRALGEIHQNQQSQAPPPLPKKSRDGGRPNTTETCSRSLHKKTLSSISLKSLSGKDSDKVPKSKDPKPNKPKKTKSSTNLATLLKRPKSAKDLKKEVEEEVQAQKDKENQSPLSADASRPTRPPPIYAQFSSEHFAKQPLGGKFLEDEIDMYTPHDYIPGKQRNFYQGPGSQPTLGKSSTSSALPRPKSTYLPSSFSVQDISRRISSGSSHSLELMRRVSGGKRPSLDRKSTANSGKSEKSAKVEKGAPNKGQRVLAAVSAFGSRPAKPEAKAGPVLDDKDVDKEFEAMLDRRNIPENQRGKMRKLAMSMKKDFIKQDWAEVAAAKNGRPGTNSSDSSADATSGSTQDAPAVKSKRPRSLTFTLSRGNNKGSTTQTKKSKPEGSIGRHSRQPSTESINGGSKSFTASSVAVAQNLVARAKGQLPDDFISYLRKVQKPELVEVGRLHKLRTLLKHETVAWTDEFVTQGGMAEIVGLLHRTMEVEWREEHEDALLHEVLLCVKALSTTALALQHLSIFQQTLFPALLNMVFGEDKKGPSEFTTRNIITSLLFTYLKSAPLAERANRARTLLHYLRDPEPTESERPVGFVLEMRRPRPYRVWCKEMTNVTKEVFWIFLHHVNVIALPGSKSRGSEEELDISTIKSSMSNTSFDTSNPYHVYMVKHFPQEQPPVPAAPYVGGVEWDATNYLASHLDIINGIMASLPTREERNTLREQMLVSGWEKCFGGTLRTCKEKFYGGVHAGLRCWVAAAHEDGWDTKDVRCGPYIESKSSPKKSPKKAAPVENAPQIGLKLDFGGEKKPVSGDVWL